MNLPSDIESFYQEQFGHSWVDLKHALSLPVKKTQLKNPFEEIKADPYELDPASLEVANTSVIKSEDKILDMCAAPGGKALSTIFKLKGDGEWSLNDLSKERIKRLKRVIKEQLPPSFQEKIKITNRDASRWGLHQPDEYDCVILDAPCSGERHLFGKQKGLEQWSLKRSKRLAQRQYALLCAAVQSAKPGGYITYSTCALLPIENDDVIKKYLKKYSDRVTPQKQNSDLGENTEYGVQILPNKAPGCGPIYYCILKKDS